MQEIEKAVNMVFDIRLKLLRTQEDCKSVELVQDAVTRIDELTYLREHVFAMLKLKCYFIP